jgi:putative SOS response-associated peptidase YedK
MCYWVGTKKVREEMLRRLQQDPDDEIAQLYYKTFVGQAGIPFREHYVAIGKAKPEISVMIHDSTEGAKFRNMIWGLQWKYTDPKTGKTTERELINSTSEKIFFVHRDIVFKQRCVIPLDGYYEFFHFTGQVYPHFLFPKDGVFYAAGVWDEQADQETGEIIAGFSIITTKPNPLAEKLHNNPKAPHGPRMLLLINKEDVLKYLDPDLNKDGLQDLFKPYDDRLMDAYPVPRFLRKEYTGNLNSDDVRQRIDYPELAFA